MPIYSFQLFFCTAQHVQISSKNCDREIQKKEKRKIIPALGWLSQLEDLTVARFNHIMNNLKCHTVYPAVLKELLLKITFVEFVELYTCAAESQMCLGVACCSSPNIQSGLAV